jgi:predicted adenine nucleotide alpha hydrolase (AANH) superfamily ATPase
MKDSNQTGQISGKKPKMLLHVCCANCVQHPVTILIDSFDITLYFYNPNIHPEEEYKKRLYDVKRTAEIKILPLVIDSYDTDHWYELTDAHKDEPEGSERCRICFLMRLEKTAETASAGNFDIIATTLSISPHKDSKTINKTGREAAKKYNISFYAADFKKKDGFRKTTELGRRCSIYRQDYCGCIYSMRKQ